MEPNGDKETLEPTLSSKRETFGLERMELNEDFVTEQTPEIATIESGIEVQISEECVDLKSHESSDSLFSDHEDVTLCQTISSQSQSLSNRKSKQKLKKQIKKSKRQAYMAFSECLSNMAGSKSLPLQETYLKDTSDSSRYKNNPFNKLNNTQKTLLNSYFSEIAENASVDFDSPEFLDIYNAIEIMLERLVGRINDRGLFTVSHIQPCGSMAEKSSIWKFDGKYVYTEFDFLAVLKNTVGSTEPKYTCEDCKEYIKSCKGKKKREETAKSRICPHHCEACFPVRKAPVDFERVEQIYKDNKYFSKSSLCKPWVMGDLFEQELALCLVAACDCQAARAHCSKEGMPWEYWFLPNKTRNSGCENCTVNMSSGTLSTNHSTIIYKHRAYQKENPSMVFLWTSKIEGLTLKASRLFKSSEQSIQIPILVDFLPALELPRRDVVSEYTHFCVPKRCVMCNDQLSGWRKSTSLYEIHYITSDMTKIHLKCYKVLKYLVSNCASLDPYYNGCNYYFKLVAIHHSRTCPGSSAGIAECVSQMVLELARAFYCDDAIPQPKIACKGLFHLFAHFADDLCSVSETDTFEEYVRNVTASSMEACRCYDHSCLLNRHTNIVW